VATISADLVNPKPKRTKARRGKNVHAQSPPRNKSFPVVGIGASAGGLEACIGLFRHLPKDTGASFVLVQHLDPTHESVLPDLLAKVTALPVLSVRNGMTAGPIGP
jgi:two-component system CheB/CheR fusion protein